MNQTTLPKYCRSRSNEMDFHVFTVANDFLLYRSPTISKRAIGVPFLTIAIPVVPPNELNRQTSSPGRRRPSIDCHLAPRILYLPNLVEMSSISFSESTADNWFASGASIRHSPGINRSKLRLKSTSQTPQRPEYHVPKPRTGSCQWPTLRTSLIVPPHSGQVPVGTSSMAMRSSLLPPPARLNPRLRAARAVQLLSTRFIHRHPTFRSPVGPAGNFRNFINIDEIGLVKLICRLYY